jgi:hypothetical protein
MGIYEIDPQILMKVLDNIELVGEWFFSDLELQIEGPSNVKSLTTGSMARLYWVSPGS